MKYKRIVLKLSGEALTGAKAYGIDVNILHDISGQIKELQEPGIEIGIVIGGGNIYRGAQGERLGINRITGDYMGMIATVINGLALKDILEKTGLKAKLQTAFAIEKFAEPYTLQQTTASLERGEIVIFAGGTGNPFFTTDTTAALRAIEINANVIFKATKVDGVYDKDPKLFKNAKFFHTLSFREALKRNLKVMDATAMLLCMEYNIPVVVFDIKGKNNLKRLVSGERIGTIVRR